MIRAIGISLLIAIFVCISVLATRALWPRTRYVTQVKIDTVRVNTVVPVKQLVYQDRIVPVRVVEYLKADKPLADSLRREPIITGVVASANTLTVTRLDTSGLGRSITYTLAAGSTFGVGVDGTVTVDSVALKRKERALRRRRWWRGAALVGAAAGGAVLARLLK